MLKGDPHTYFSESQHNSTTMTEERHDRRKLLLGICVMDKKARAKPMTRLLERLSSYAEFEIVHFGNECILQLPIEQWPVVDVLIAFYSDGFPLAKASEYVQLRQPYCLNDVSAQWALLDRRAVYAILRENGIPTPPGLVFVNRDEDCPVSAYPHIAEFPDHIEVDGVVIRKPFVEKPSSGEDHNVYIYFPNNGGQRRLFRKVENCSSQLYPDENSVRKDGSYVYEELLPSPKDIKVYTVGSTFAYAETRKSPTIDGVVERDANGKELRYVVRLSDEEQEIAKRVCTAFRQTVCGFDLLRSNGKSYVIDVNGWSFVKNSLQYYDTCASIIRTMCLQSDIGQRKFALNLQQEQELLFRLSTATAIVNPLNNNILRAVVGVFRHGDRTPKQKLKWKSEDAEMFALFNSFPNQDGEVKMRESVEKAKFLNVIQTLKARETSNELVLRRYQCVEFVLEHDKQCKVQLKPKFKKSKDSPSPTEQSAPTLSSLQVVVKWGGALTHAGLKQSSEYGHTFRDQLFLTHNPSKRREFLSGLQAFTSDEDRVKETARAFCQSLLECDELPSDTLHESNFLDDMLDGVDAAKERVEVAKAQIQKYLTSESGDAPVSFALANPLKQLRKVYGLIGQLREQIIQHCQIAEKAAAQGLPVPLFNKSDPKLAAQRLAAAASAASDASRAAAASAGHSTSSSPHPELDHSVKPKGMRREMSISNVASILAQLHLSNTGTGTGVLDAVSRGVSSTLASAVCSPAISRPGSPPRINSSTNLSQLASRMPILSPLSPSRHSVSTTPQAALESPVWPEDSVISVSRSTMVFAPQMVSAPNLPVSNGISTPVESKPASPPILPVAAPVLTPTPSTAASQTPPKVEDSSILYEPVEDYDDGVTALPIESLLCQKEALILMRERWDKLYQEFYDPTTDTFDTTKIADLYDCLKYDVLHNSSFLSYDNLSKVYYSVKKIADFVIPHEYGLEKEDKLAIGLNVAKPLLQRICQHLEAGFESKPAARTHLYFTSESHIHALRNSLVLGGMPANASSAESVAAMQINYLSHGVFRLFEDVSVPVDSPDRFYVNVMFSPGAAGDPFAAKNAAEHRLPIMLPVPLCGRVPFSEFKRIIGDMAATCLKNKDAPTEQSKSTLNRAQVQIIVNADDLGYSQRRDEGIFHAHLNGPVHSASLIVNVNQENAKRALYRAVEIGMDVGLHLNLTEGAPICDPALVSSLLVRDQSGSLAFRGKHGFREAWASGLINIADIRRECLAQYFWFVRHHPNHTGPTRFDGHQHVHVVEGMPAIIAPLYAALGVRMTRLCLELENSVDFSHLPEHVASFYKQVIRDSKQAHSVYSQFGVNSAQSFVGLCTMGSNMTGAAVTKQLQLLANAAVDGTATRHVEWMVHCGYPSLDGDEFSQSQDRLTELEFLTGHELKQILEKFQIRVSDWQAVTAQNEPTGLSSHPSRPKRIVFLSPLQDATGNATTALRIQSGMESFGHHVNMINSVQIKELDQVNCQVDPSNCDLVVALHAHRSGRLLVHSNPIAPIIIILGGTDCTLPVHSPEKVETALIALRRAVCIVAFNQEMVDSLVSWAPDVAGKLVIVAPAFSLSSVLASSASSTFSLRAKLDKANISSIPFSASENAAKIFLLIAGLRPVKDVLFLFDVIRQWHQRDPAVHLVLMGPILDADYAKLVLSSLDGQHDDVRYGNGVIYLPPVPPGDALRALQEADIAVNTSISEGMSNVLIEAMAVGTPCVVRNNDGNRSLIKHQESGLLFSTPEEFVAVASALLQDSAMQHRFVVSALKMVRQLSDSGENLKYQDLIAKHAL